MNRHKKYSKKFDREEVSDIRSIIKILDKEELIRHINGNTLDNRIGNLQYVTARQSFENKSWVVDAVCCLTKREFKIWCKEREKWNGEMMLFE